MSIRYTEISGAFELVCNDINELKSKVNYLEKELETQNLLNNLLVEKLNRIELQLNSLE